MSRSSWKISYIDPEFLKQQLSKSREDEFVLINRATVLTNDMVGLQLQIYNGIRFFQITVTPDMIGHRAGEFAPTRKKPVAKKKKNTK